MNVDGSEFSNNQATKNGGAVYGYTRSKLEIKNSTFTANESLVSTGDAGGGAMYFSGSHAELENVEFSNNVAGRNGGAFCAYSAAQVTVTNMTATSNRSGYRGGVIYIGSSGTVVSIYSGEANSNTATNNGNTIYCGGSSTLNIKTDAFTYEAGSIKGTIKEI